MLAVVAKTKSSSCGYFTYPAYINRYQLQEKRFLYLYVRLTMNASASLEEADEAEEEDQGNIDSSVVSNPLDSSN